MDKSQRHAGRGLLRRAAWIGLLALLVPLLGNPGTARADEPEYPEDLVVRAAQAADAIVASGANPDNVADVAVFISQPWAYGLPVEAPFSYYSPALADQVVILPIPAPGDPRPIHWQVDCNALRQANEQADQLLMTTTGLTTGYGLLLAWAQNYGLWAAQLIPALRVAVAVMGVMSYAVGAYRYGLERERTFACPA
jgi:hypothetical protein